jgi:hypothetical protein
MDHFQRFNRQCMGLVVYGYWGCADDAVGNQETSAIPERVQGLSQAQNHDSIRFLKTLKQ